MALVLAGTLLVTPGLLHAATSGTNLLDVFVSMLFNPYAVDSATVVVIADIHMSVTPALGLPITNLDSRLVDMVNAMSPPPAKIVCAGDLTVAGSVFFGAPPDTNSCRQELLIAQSEFTRFTTAPVVPIPGNHDTYGTEGDEAVLFNSVFTNSPAYGKFEVMGLPAFYLFGHESGYLDPPQAAWLRNEISQLSPTQQVALFVHQPPMNGIAVERGIKPVLLQALGNWQTPVWAYAGHVHGVGGGSFALRHTVLNQVTVSSPCPRISRAPEGWSGATAGFLIICIRNGQIVGNVFGALTNATYYPVELPDNATPTHLIFDRVPHPLLLLEEGDYDRAEYGEHCKSAFSQSGGTDTGQWWSYIDDWRVRVPLGNYNGLATHFLVATPNARPDSIHVENTNLRKVSFQFRTEASNTVPAAVLWCTNQVAWIEIPPALRTNTVLWLEATNNQGDEFHLGAWGLATTNEVTLPVPPRIVSFAVQPGGERRFELMATPQLPCWIESSTDFVDWETNYIHPNPSGVLRLRDASPLPGVKRFYRVGQTSP